MARALPTPPRMQRAELERLQRERDALRLKLGNAQRLHRVLREQSEALRERRARIEDCPELRTLIRVARASARRRFEFGGCVFAVRRGAVFSAIYTAKGRHLASFPGSIFDV
jgi:hypothetical protein